MVDSHGENINNGKIDLGSSPLITRAFEIGPALSSMHVDTNTRVGFGKKLVNIFLIGFFDDEVGLVCYQPNILSRSLLGFWK